MSEAATADFVNNILYQRVLGAQADQGGLDYWCNQIDSGAMTTGQVMEAFLLSSDFLSFTAPIVRLYLGTLSPVEESLRYPENAATGEGPYYWITNFRGDQPLVEIAQFFLDSDESLYTAPDESSSIEDIAAYVDDLYQFVLGRAADEDGGLFWTSAIANGEATAAEVLVAFIQSEEAKNNFATTTQASMAYVGTLFDMTDAQLADFEAALDADTPLDEVLTEILVEYNATEPEFPAPIDGEDNVIDLGPGDFDAVDGVAEIFEYDIDTSSGRAVQQDGEATVNGFNVAEDTLRFVDISTSGNIDTATFLDFPGVNNGENPFANETFVFFDANEDGAAGGVTLTGILDGDFETIPFDVVS